MTLHAVSFPVLPIVNTHLIINCVLVFFTLVVVGLRMLSRYMNGAKLWWDDWIILFCVPQGIGMLVIQGLYTPMGVGYPITETMPNLVVILKLMVSYALIYTFCISFVKISVLCFYLRVFVNKGLRLATKIVLGVVAAWTLGNLLLLFLICRPFEANFGGEGECGDIPKAFIAIGAFNIISDFVILLLPIPTVWRLNSKRQMKIALTCVFLVGLLVSIIAVARIFSLEHLQLENITETMVWVDFLSTTEVNLGILCVSLPMLGPVYNAVLRRRGASRIGNSSPSGARHYKNESSSGDKSGGRRPPRGHDTIALEDIYAPDMDPHSETTVSAARFGGEADSLDGSETSLAPRPKKRRPEEGGKTGITVQKQWEIRQD